VSAIPTNQLADLTSHHIEGIAHQGNTPFCVPLFSQIDGNLWMGGCPRGTAPEHFKFVFCLYPWEPYGVHDHQVHLQVKLFDHGELPDKTLLAFLADAVNMARAVGPTLVHCQAGLNRSGLLTAFALIRAGAAPADAIALVRKQRCDAVLCNPAFEMYLRDYRRPQLEWPKTSNEAFREGVPFAAAAST
jgi:protein-tyrosine phosphatase